jgi:hypothetical protein
MPLNHLIPRYIIITCNEDKAKLIMAQTLMFADIFKASSLHNPGRAGSKEKILYGMVKIFSKSQVFGDYQEVLPVQSGTLPADLEVAGT